MAAAVERAKEWWEGKAPRERRLIAVLGATAVICVLAWTAITIRSHLAAIEKQNQEARDALAAIDRHRIAMASQASQKAPVVIPDQPVSLDSYLNPIINDLGLPEPTYPGVKETVKGPYAEASITVTLKDLDIDQLKNLLERIETRSPVVAVTELHVKKNTFRDQEKNLEVGLTVVTYYKKKAGGAGGAKPGESGGSGPGGGGGSSGGASPAGDSTR